jgi:hypothetical protein
LGDWGNWKSVESLKRLEPQTRAQQLCGFEAILQINRRFDGQALDFVVAPKRSFGRATPLSPMARR